MSALEPDALLGREIGGYRIDEVIGRGGMGVVYRAEHIRLGRRVALKVVAPQIAREEKFRERFLRESRTAGTLDHPNVVPMYDAGEADGVLYIAMRYVDGVDLATLIAREGPLDPARTARIVAQVAGALDAAHEAGLVHRDVKPSNVLLPARGAGRGEHAYLGDFGLTKRVLSESGVTGSSAFLGTIAYVAPEQIEGRPVDAKTDQYSLACLVYECLTGHKPFERETDIATLYAHIRDPFPSVGDAVSPDLQVALDAALRRAAAKQPAERYESCGDFAEDLIRITGAASATGTRPVAAAPGTRQAARRVSWERRGAIIGLGSATAIVAVVAVGIYLILGGGGSTTPVVVGNGLAVINATTGAVTLATELPAAPSNLAVDGTAAWVVHFAGDSVTRVDAATSATTRISVGDGPTGIAAGDDSGLLALPDGQEADPRVWVTNATSETMSEIDVQNFERGAASQVLGFRAGPVAVGGGHLWIIDTQDDSLRNIDLATSGVDPDSVAVEAEPISVVASDVVVWVANSLDQSLSRLPIGAATAEAAIPLDFTPGAMAFDPESSALWIIDRDGDQVVRFHTGSRDVEEFVAVGSRPVAVAIGAGSVWVANAGDGTVTRIDPATNEVLATLTIGGAPAAIAVHGDMVWVAVAER